MTPPAPAARTVHGAPKAPSQFQRHVHELTGQWLPHFGADFFERGIAQSYAAPAAWASPAPDNYVLGPGDQVRVRISGAVELVSHQTIDRNGLITLPKVGTLALAGVPLRELDALVRERVARVYTHVQVDVSLGKLRGITVYVVGHAQAPGAYTLPSLSTMVNAVFASGGPNSLGSMRQIVLRRAGKVVAELDLYAFVVLGDSAQDVPLQAGDLISIAPAGPRVALTGATDHQAIFEVKPQTHLRDLLSWVGGVPVLAHARQVVIERIEPGDMTAPRRVMHLALDGTGLSELLVDGDVLRLLQVRPTFANAVTLQGAVAQPLRHPWREGMRISDVIPDPQALMEPDFYKRRTGLVSQRLQGQSPLDLSKSTQPMGRDGQPPQEPERSLVPLAKAMADKKGPDQPEREAGQGAPRVGQANPPLPGQPPGGRWTLPSINWNYAVVQRLNRTTLQNEWIGFDLGKAVMQRDPQHNLLLQADDVITVLSSADLQLPVHKTTRLVRLEGEVAAPGLYAVQPGETLPDLIVRAGGLTAQAYVFGTEFTRESVRTQQQGNLDQLVRRLEAQMQSQAASTPVNLGADRLNQTQALMQVQQQQIQSQLSRLKALRSKGRLSLELGDSVAQDATQGAWRRAIEALPKMALEDGDAISVPSRPSFVTALGSVNNENVILFRVGQRVVDLIRAAGLTDDADAAQAFLLRADGSVVSRRHAGWWSSFEQIKLMPGDTLVVPPKLDRESGYSVLVRGMRDWTQIFSNLGIGAAAIRTLRN